MTEKDNIASIRGHPNSGRGEVAMFDWGYPLAENSLFSSTPILEAQLGIQAAKMGRAAAASFRSGCFEVF